MREPAVFWNIIFIFSVKMHKTDWLNIAKGTFCTIFSWNVYTTNMVNERKYVENICETGFLIPLSIDPI